MNFESATVFVCVAVWCWAWHQCGHAGWWDPIH